MTIFRKVILLLTFSFVIHTFSFCQSQQDSSKVERELKSVLDEYVQNANRGDFKAMRHMLTDDYFLFQNSRRYTADETIEMISNSKLSDITFSINNVKNGSGGNIAFLTFDLDWHGKINGNTTDAEAMETYLFRKEGGKWKMQAKSVVMMDKKAH